MPLAVQSRRFDGAGSFAARSPFSQAGRPATTLVAIGNFDGVHRGHRCVLGAAVESARRLDLVPLVLTFHPHPAIILGRRPQPALTPLDRKVELLCRFDESLRVVVEPFTLELGAMTPRQFVERLLVGQLGAKVVMVGDNFRFGRDRTGDFPTLAALGAELGFEARSTPLAGDETGAFSSSRARAAIAAGDLADAEHVLGRPHALSGVPPNGVYTCLVDELDGEGRHGSAIASGVANIGVRPTVAGGFSVEAHLFDFDRELYGRRLRLHLVGRLRDERKFAGLTELKQQIERDVTAARAALAGRRPAPDAGGAWY
jgi:riboflavin kinase/FMN adenylyltransferase